VRRVALTGAAGSVGTLIRPGIAASYRLRSSDRRRIARLNENEEFVRADIRSASSLRRAFYGCDAIVHLAAAGGDSGLNALLETNVKGTHNVLEAARAEGVRRVVLASTGHVTGFYRREETIDENDPVRPDSLYAVSKIACEALGRLYADKYALQVACIRIGRLSPAPEGEADRAIWCSPADLVRLIRVAVEMPNLHFETVYGVSNNRARWWSDAAARRIGYEPCDDAATHTFDTKPRRDVGAFVQGAEFAARGFSGDLERFAATCSTPT
jgi:uronate dehydrogenase